MVLVWRFLSPEFWDRKVKGGETMKKKGLLLLMAMLLLTSGCGEKAPEEEKKEVEKQQESEVEKNEQEEIPDSNKEVPKTSEEGNTEVNTPEETPGEIPGETSQQQEEKRELLEISLSHQWDGEWSDSQLCYVREIEYSKLRLENDSREKYPKLQKALEEYNLQKDDYYLGNLKEQQQEQVADYIRAMEEFGDELYLPFYNREQSVVTRADDKALSILLTTESYAGEAHGNYYKSGVCFDPETGKMLTLEDVFADTSQLPKKIYQKLMDQYDLSDMYDDPWEYIKENYHNLSWTMDYQGVVVYFNTYEIGPYASGIFTVRLDYRDYPELFNSKYTSVPESYAIDGDPFGEYLYDFDEDGKEEWFRIVEYKGEYDWINRVDISLGEHTLEVEDLVCGYSLNYAIVHTRSSKNYLKISQTADNDWQSVVIFDLSGEIPEYVTTYQGLVCDSVFEEKGEDFYSGRIMLTNPDACVFSSRMNILSTFGGNKQYYFTQEGKLETQQENYDVNMFYSLNVVKAFNAELVEEGKSTGKQVTVEAGSVVYIVATDGKDWVDLNYNGSVVRVYVECESWPQTIDGVEIDQLFEMLYFAG